MKQDENQYICDMACGCGANLAYLASKYPKSNFLGIELEKRLVVEGRKRLQFSNAEIIQGDWYKPDSTYINEFDGIISFQTLSWLSEYKTPLSCLACLNPDWIANSSLFYEGDIDYFISVNDYTEDEINYKEIQYNIYSLIRIKKTFESL